MWLPPTPLTRLASVQGMATELIPQPAYLQRRVRAHHTRHVARGGCGWQCSSVGDQPVGCGHDAADGTGTEVSWRRGIWAQVTVGMPVCARAGFKPWVWLYNANRNHHSEGGTLGVAVTVLLLPRTHGQTWLLPPTGRYPWLVAGFCATRVRSRATRSHSVCCVRAREGDVVA